ncbi:hypothetical protein BDF14DRAFT_1995150 [Spinellus fusiger]|nr:hypothetical protein BDF14DRAFT_1995150 [Spinellus fusiger]
MRKPIHSVARKLGRMSWNKYNLFNIVNKDLPNLNNKTLFQQKWLAKKETRAYHGDQVNERQFKSKFFNSKLPTVHEGSQNLPHPTVAVLTYAELERRIDFVIFRSNFCSSIYAARQLCVHGKVKVNGAKLAFPSHKLKDGDVVTVDPHSIQMLKGEKETELDFEFKPFSQPFLFVPEYLEVNYNTCQTVLLRSPISRPGRSEIPSPLPQELHSLAYEYYARTAEHELYPERERPPTPPLLNLGVSQYLQEDATGPHANRAQPIASMERRCYAVIDAKGGHIDY